MSGKTLIITIIHKLAFTERREEMNNTKLKKIVYSLLVIIISFGLALGISRALFEDKQTFDTTISMGTLELQVGEDGPAGVPLDFDNMVPGETRTVIFDVDNVGSIEGNFWARGEIIEASENGIKDCARLSLYRLKDDGLFDNVINNMLLRNIEDDFDIDPNTANDAAINNGPAEMHLIVNTLACGSETMGDVLQANLYLYLTQIVESN